MAKPVLRIIIGSTRPGRVGPSVAAWITDRAIEHGGFDVQVTDLAELNLPFLDEPNHPRLRQYTHQHTKDWSALVDASDAFIFVTPEYNHGFNAVVKNAIDYLHGEWQHKPAGIVSYGGVAAGTRATQMLSAIGKDVRGSSPRVSVFHDPSTGRLPVPRGDIRFLSPLSNVAYSHGLRQSSYFT